MAEPPVELPAPQGSDAAPPFPRLIALVNALRRVGLALLLAVLGTTAAVALISPRLLALMQGQLRQRLVFYSVAEPFVAHAKLSLATALLLTLPLIAACLWRALGLAFSLSRTSQVVFTAFSCLLFYGGALFCYLITLKYGIDFLLGFSSAQLQPLISIDQFVTFVTVFVLGFGLIFELPIFMIFTARVGLLPRALFEKNRRYAILVISILAALLTPTPDLVNMLLMGLPLYGLYEVGIVVLRLLAIP